jgi:hypothetical protein
VSGIDGRTVLICKIALTVTALALLVIEEWRARRGRPIEGRLRTPIAAGLALLALAAYCNFGRFRGDHAIHTWDTFHYYIGSKYSRELSYGRIYECTAVAEAESGRAREPWQIRDLETGKLVSAADAITDPDQCKRHFSDGRWAEFKRDVAYFWGRVTDRRWSGINQDHGYNAPPVWTMAGTLLSNLAPASDRSVGLLVALDPLLLLGAFVALAWAFGERVVTLAAFYFGVNDPSAIEWTWGAFLRNDWLLWLILAICLIRKGRPGCAGACLAYASLLRLFPVLLFLGPTTQAAAAFWRTRTIGRELGRFFLGAAGGGVLLVAASVAVVGRDAYPRFAEHILRFQDTPLTNHMGLRTILSYRPSGRVEEIKKLDVMDPWPIWKQRRRAHFRALLPVYLAVVAAFAAVFIRVVMRAVPWQAIALGLAWIPVLVQLTGYYYCFPAAMAALTVDRRRRAVDALLLAIALGGQIAAASLFWWDDIYAAASVPAVLCALLLPVAWLRASPSEGPRR